MPIFATSVGGKRGLEATGDGCILNHGNYTRCGGIHLSEMHNIRWFVIKITSRRLWAFPRQGAEMIFLGEKAAAGELRLWLLEVSLLQRPETESGCLHGRTTRPLSPGTEATLTSPCPQGIPRGGGGSCDAACRASGARGCRMWWKLTAKPDSERDGGHPWRKGASIPVEQGSEGYGL